MGKNLDQIPYDVNKELYHLKIWFDTNRLSLNLKKKTKYIIFSNRQMKNQSWFMARVTGNDVILGAVCETGSQIFETR